MLSGVWQYGASESRGSQAYRHDRTVNGTVGVSAQLWSGRSSRRIGTTIVGLVDRRHSGTIGSRRQSDAIVVIVLVISFLTAL